MTTEEIKELIKNIDYSKNFLKDYNGLLLTENQVDILKKYGINFKECGSISELLYSIDEVLKETDCYELELVALDLQERNYYENTNK